MTLYFFYQLGCDACASAEPIVSAFTRRTGVNLIRRNIALDNQVMQWHARGTPAYALLDRGELARTAVGLMTEKQLERFCDLDREIVRRPRKKKIVGPREPEPEAEPPEPEPEEAPDA